MFLIDHHIHTTRYSPDSVLTPEELVSRAREVGLNGIAITEHDRLWPESELEELRAGAEGLTVLAGVEVSAIEGHFLVYGLKNLDDVFAGITLDRLLTVVRREKAAIVAAHPFRWGQEFDVIVETHGAVFDGIEFVSNNVTRQTRQLTERLLAKHPMARTGSSDAHGTDVLGCYCTAFPKPIRTTSEFVTALRSGAGRPRHNGNGPWTSGPVDA